MAKAEKCPNCGHFELKTKDYRETIGGVIFGICVAFAFITDFEFLGTAIIICLVGMFIAQMLPLPKTVTVICKNCKYEAKVKRK